MRRELIEQANFEPPPGFTMKKFPSGVTYYDSAKNAYETLDAAWEAFEKAGKGLHPDINLLFSIKRRLLRSGYLSVKKL